MSATEIVGFLRKNHAGKPFAIEWRRRLFVSSGYEVAYYADEKCKKLKGKFSLLNVTAIVPTPATEAENAISLSLCETAEHAIKTLVISFAGDPAAKPRWLRAWCSAVPRSSIDASLLQHVDAKVAAALAGGVSAESPKVSERSGRHELDTPRDEQQYQAYEVIVPRSAVPGDKLKFTLPTGEEAVVLIPEGAKRGAPLCFELPKTASTDARIREKEASAAIQASPCIRARHATLHARHTTHILAASSRTVTPIPTPPRRTLLERGAAAAIAPSLCSWGVPRPTNLT